MRRRQGYTLIELLVSMALIMTIMAILSQAYVSGLDTFSKLKGIGDMSEKLRVATSILRRDLSADHFTGAARISDPNFSNQPPLDGFFRVAQGAASAVETVDSFGNPSLIATSHILHFSVKLRGNRQQDFFNGDPAVAGATFFSQPTDATYGGFQWGEVCYYVLPVNQATTGPMQRPMYALYRSQRAVVTNTTGLGAGNPNLMSISPNGFNTPSTLQNPANRGIQIPASLTGTVDTLLLSDVLNFDIQVMPAGTFGFSDVQGGNFDSSQLGAGQPGLSAIQIMIRVYDMKTRQARQITLVQDL